MAIGPKMCPSTPVKVNSGTKLAVMIAAEKKIALFTSEAASAIVVSSREDAALALSVGGGVLGSAR